MCIVHQNAKLFNKEIQVYIDGTLVDSVVMKAPGLNEVYIPHTLHYKLCLIHVPYSYCYMIVKIHVLLGGLMCTKFKLYICKICFFLFCVCVPHHFVLLYLEISLLLHWVLCVWYNAKKVKHFILFDTSKRYAQLLQ